MLDLAILLMLVYKFISDFSGTSVDSVFSIVTIVKMAKFQSMIGGSKMPSIGLGTWQSTNEEELTKAVDAALEAGYRHIDTAFIYGNEAVIGKVLHKWLSSGKLKREELFITTKLPPQGLHPDRVEMYLKKSLEALQLAYVDLYLIHVPFGLKYDETDPTKYSFEGAPTDHIAIWKKMEEQVDAGRAKTIGVSNFNIKQIQRLLDNGRIRPASQQVEITPYFQQKELVEFCHRNKIVIVGYSTFGSPGASEIREMMQSGPPPDILNDPTIKKIADKHKKTTAQVILRYFIEKNIVIIPKSVTPSRIKQNIDVYDWSLSKDDVQAIEKLERGKEARGADMSKLAPDLKKHPEFPW